VRYLREGACAKTETINSIQLICARCKRGYKSEEDIENREGFDLREDSAYRRRLQ